MLAAFGSVSGSILTTRSDEDEMPLGPGRRRAVETSSMSSRSSSTPKKPTLGRPIAA